MSTNFAGTSIKTIATLRQAKVWPGAESARVAVSQFHSYFDQLHGLLNGVAVTRKDGSSLSAEEGMREAVSMLIETRSKTKAKAIVIGNGGSAAIASHAALDLWNACGLRATAFNDAAQLTCLSNDHGYEFVFSRAIEMFGDKEDILIAISSSGNSPSILNAVDAAKEIGLRTITFAGFAPDSRLNATGDLRFYVESNHYGFVEVAHMALLHQLTDRLAETTRGF